MFAGYIVIVIIPSLFKCRTVHKIHISVNMKIYKVYIIYMRKYIPYVVHKIYVTIGDFNAADGEIFLFLFILSILKLNRGLCFDSLDAFIYLKF